MRAIKKVSISTPDRGAGGCFRRSQPFYSARAHVDVMKKFIVDFEGEEEAHDGAAESRAWGPEFVLVCQDVDDAATLCAWLARRDIPSVIIKYKHSAVLRATGISDDIYFGVGVRIGDGVELYANNKEEYKSFTFGRHHHFKLSLGASAFGKFEDADPIENIEIIDTTECPG